MDELRKSFRQKLCFRIGAIFFGVVISLMILEFGAHIYSKFKNKNCTEFVEPPEILNSLGMRDVEHRIVKPDDTYRILVIGDSFTWGGGIEFNHIYAEHLQNLLNKRIKNTKFEVIIFARAGASTYNEEDYLEKAGLVYNPDLVIIGFCLNDTEYWIDKELMRKLRQPLFKSDPEELAKKWYGKFQLVRFIHKRMENSRINKAFIEYYKNLYQDDYIGWKVFKKSIKHLSQICKHNKINALMVIFPIFSHDFDDSYPFADIHKKVKEEALSDGLDVFDLLPVFKGQKMQC